MVAPRRGPGMSIPGRVFSGCPRGAAGSMGRGRVGSEDTLAGIRDADLLAEVEAARGSFLFATIAETILHRQRARDAEAAARGAVAGRRQAMAGLRQDGGLSGFTKRSESPHDPFGAGHSSTSISAALGFAAARDLGGDPGQCQGIADVIGDVLDLGILIVVGKDDGILPVCLPAHLLRPGHRRRRGHGTSPSDGY